MDQHELYGIYMGFKWINMVIYDDLYGIFRDIMVI